MRPMSRAPQVQEVVVGDRVLDAGEDLGSGESWRTNSVAEGTVFGAEGEAGPAGWRSYARGGGQGRGGGEWLTGREDGEEGAYVVTGVGTCAEF